MKRKLHYTQNEVLINVNFLKRQKIDGLHT